MSSGYELHQKLRTKTVRLLKKRDYDAAVDALYSGAKQLLEAKDQGSGCDLAIYMIDVYEQSQKPCNDVNRKRVTDLLSLTGPDFWRKKVLDAALKWSTSPAAPFGDPSLRIFAAGLSAEDGSFFSSEGHLFAACGSSETDPDLIAKSLASISAAWLESYAESVVKVGASASKESVERILVGDFALRIMIPLLAAESLAIASAFMTHYLETITTKHRSLLLPMTPNPRVYEPPGGVPGSSQRPPSSQLYVTASPNLNFVQMALAMVKGAEWSRVKTKGAPLPTSLKDSWKGLVGQWRRESEHEFSIYSSSLGDISSAYFQLSPPRQAPNMMEMMAGLMGGKPNGGGGQAEQGPKRIRQAPSLAPPEMKEGTMETNEEAGGAMKDVDDDLD